MQVHQADDRPGITLHSSACCVVCGDCATVDWEVGNESVVPGAGRAASENEITNDGCD